MRQILTIIVLLSLFLGCSKEKSYINRYKVVQRNSPVITAIDTLASLTVGNGNFAFTVDATGLQTFPEFYKLGVPLGTQSQWGWHEFPNKEGYKFSETIKEYDFNRGRLEPYSVQFNEEGHERDAVNYFRSNPHRLHLGIVGLELTNNENKPLEPDDLSDIHQNLNLWTGKISSHFNANDLPVEVVTTCSPNNDIIASTVTSRLLSAEQLKIKFHFPFPTANHSDDACDWNQLDQHTTSIVEESSKSVVLKRVLDSTKYFVVINWKGNASFSKKSAHYYLLSTKDSSLTFTTTFVENLDNLKPEENDTIIESSENFWSSYWKNGGFVDFGECKSVDAKELERRVILSQYLMAIQCSGTMPPQETGLTYNSWFGKYHLEMHWWHTVHFALWNRLDLMERSLDWYTSVEPVAKDIAERQGYDGVRWMKMTDPSGAEAPSSIGSFLIWQQPHYIYFSELVYRQKPTEETLNKYKNLVFKTAEFMASFASYDSLNQRYTLHSIIPAQETLKPEETINPPFELSYWHYGLSTAQKWRERAGLARNPQWDEIINHLSTLAEKDGLYLAAETAPQTYSDIRFTSDHMAVLGALGILPTNPLLKKETMSNTLNWVWNNWNWDHTWGWDYPMTAMCAARLDQPQMAVNALLMKKRTNTYLPNGHNFQDERLRVYLPGNGGLLTAVAMMCAGWDNCTTDTPGFPKDGDWNVKWEDIKPMP